jgi:hypothetical protein
MNTKYLLKLLIVLSFLTTITQANESPTADAGPDKYVSFGDDVVLYGSGSDTEGPVTFQWVRLIDSPIPPVPAADTPTLSFEAPRSVESLTYQLTVTDNEGMTATDDVVVTVLEDASNAIFVSSTLGHDDWVTRLDDPSFLDQLSHLGLGSREFPVESLEKATELAAAHEPPADICVHEGDYPPTRQWSTEALVIADGVSVYGGFEVVLTDAPGEPTGSSPVFGLWKRIIPPVLIPAIVTTEHPTTYYGCRRAVEVRDVTTPTTIDGLIIRSQPGRDTGGLDGAGENSIGIYVYDCNESLTITNNQINAGKGGYGREGMAGSPGDPGTSGQDGENGCRSFCYGIHSITYGGQGGQSSCWVLAGQGGRGGDCYSDSITNPNAAVKLGASKPDWKYGGEDPRLGYTSGEQGGYRSPLGGEGGHGGGWWRTVFGVHHKFRLAGSGELGREGEHGAGSGGGGPREGSIVDHKWVGGHGGEGQDADPKTGQGRGGGGGGAGWPYVCGGNLGNKPGIRPMYVPGGGGGGGGGGGCPGGGGTGGTPGGGSFGIFLSCSSPHIRFNRISTVGGGDGGSGGRGGDGGKGGEPGEGGSSGYGRCEGTDFYGAWIMDFVQSGKGRRGSHGGYGGSGCGRGGGSGGASCGIFWKENSELHVAFNTYDIGPAGAGRAGGAGSERVEDIIWYLTRYGEWLESHGERHKDIFKGKEWNESLGEELPEVQKNRLENLKTTRGEPGQDGLHNKFCPPVGSGTDGNGWRRFVVEQNTVAYFKWDIPSGMFSFSPFMAFGGSDIVLSLVSPSGRIIDRSTIAPDVAHFKNPTFESYTVTDPEEGGWTIRLFGADVPPEGEEALVGVTLIHANEAPTAGAGLGRAVECTSSTETGITLDGSGSSDGGCCGTLAFEWKDSGGQVVGTTPQVSLMLPVGIHTFTLTVDDGQGGTDTDAVTITVEDTTSPAITLNGAETVVLMHGRDTYAEPGASAIDICDGNVPVIIGGDQVDTSTPGTYVVTYEAMDASGNTAQATRMVDVIKVPILEESLEPLDHLTTISIEYAGHDSQGGLYIVEVMLVVCQC